RESLTAGLASRLGPGVFLGGFCGWFWNNGHNMWGCVHFTCRKSLATQVDMNRGVEEERERIPMSQRPEWADIRPVPQDDGPNPVVPITPMSSAKPWITSEPYTWRMNDPHAHFNSLKKSFFSIQGITLFLAVNVKTIGSSVDAYKAEVWQFRRLILDALNVDLHEELHFVDQITKDNSKNYQIWHHRRWVAEKLGTQIASKELEFTREIFSQDAKNYHAWSHRQWVLQALGGWENELAYCDELLEDDIFNNSAWNQRYFVVTRSPLLGGLEVMRDSEVAYAIKAILAKPENESPWRYLRGLYKNNVNSLVNDPRVASVCLDVLLDKRDCVHALNMVLDLLSHHHQPSNELKDAVDAVSPDPKPSDSNFAERVCSILQLVDPIRASYWRWRKTSMPAQD
ncbi:protein farnesyltransferase/geranylgeranyltransferase type-1 subunit alpha, partial [Sesamum angolense]